MIENIPEELQEIHKKVDKIAKELGLDTFPTVFQMCDNEAVNTLAAREGFPERYPHWRFGMSYNELKMNKKAICDQSTKLMFLYCKLPLCSCHYF